MTLLLPFQPRLDETAAHAKMNHLHGRPGGGWPGGGQHAGAAVPGSKAGLPQVGSSGGGCLCWRLRLLTALFVCEL